MSQDFRTYLDRVVSTPQEVERRGSNLTISHPKVPVVRWHEDMKGCHSIDEVEVKINEVR